MLGLVWTWEAPGAQADGSKPAPREDGGGGLGAVREQTGHSGSSFSVAGLKNSVSSLGAGRPGTSVGGDGL